MHVDAHLAAQADRPRSASRRPGTSCSVRLIAVRRLARARSSCVSGHRVEATSTRGRRPRRARSAVRRCSLPPSGRVTPALAEAPPAQELKDRRFGWLTRSPAAAYSRPALECCSTCPYNCPCPDTRDQRIAVAEGCQGTNCSFAHNRHTSAGVHGRIGALTRRHQGRRGSPVVIIRTPVTTPSRRSRRAARRTSDTTVTVGSASAPDPRVTRKARRPPETPGTDRTTSTPSGACTPSSRLGSTPVFLRVGPSGGTGLGVRVLAQTRPPRVDFEKRYPVGGSAVTQRSRCRDFDESVTHRAQREEVTNMRKELTFADLDSERVELLPARETLFVFGNNNWAPSTRPTRPWPSTPARTSRARTALRSRRSRVNQH